MDIAPALRAAGWVGLGSFVFESAPVSGIVMDFWNSAAKDRGGGIPLGGGPRGGGPVGVLLLVLKSVSEWVS